MRINHNITAMNSYRNFSANTSKLSKNLEKVSTGMKINRAGDDAAGLAISEKMRAQISGIEGATKNAKDGISLIQTAEGALTEVHDMLNRMTTLAEQSANGTYDDDVDRNQLQKEVDALKEEIDRIADSTNYNGIKLLDGSLGSGGGSTIKITNHKATDVAAVAGTYETTISTTCASQAGSKIEFTLNLRSSSEAPAEARKFTFEIVSNSAGTPELVGNSGDHYAVSGANNGVKEEDLASALCNELRKAGFDDQFTMSVNAKKIGFTAKTEGTNGAKIESLTARTISASGEYGEAKNQAMTAEAATGKPSDAGVQLTGGTCATYDGTNADKAVFQIGNDKFAFADPSKVDVSALDKDVTVLISGDGKFTASHAYIVQQKTGLQADATTSADNLILRGSAGSSGGLTLQIGDTSDSYNKLTVSVGDMHARSIGIGDVDISTQEGAAAALNKIKASVNNVSNTRGTLGALQNRLDHTINNLGVARENIQSAESLIRDTDVAEEMMNYTKNNILNQSAQAMLAQANQLPQGVLQLLG